VACPAGPYFSTLSHKLDDFGEKVIEHKMCIFIFCTFLPEIFLIPSRIERDAIKIFIGLHAKYPLFLSDINEA
jgi:hypothetical protein